MMKPAVWVGGEAVSASHYSVWDAQGMYPFGDCSRTHRHCRDTYVYARQRRQCRSALSVSFHFLRTPSRSTGRLFTARPWSPGRWETFCRHIG